MQEQVYLSYITKGGVSYSDSEMMSPYERKIALEYMCDLFEKQKELREQRRQSHNK